MFVQLRNSTSMGFASTDSIKHRLKIFERKNIPESKNSQKQNLNLSHAEHYAESMQMK